ncbi:MAG TPA: energy transducer TonB [Candidatus Angelobacter sp.]|nr:energy transducer TonB [Candidatus Angelobacter sp.]
MSNRPIADELDHAIEQMLATPELARANSGQEVEELLAVAADLRDLPRDNFKTRLRLELEWEAAGRTVVTANAGQTEKHAPAMQPASANTASLPGLFGKAWSGYPVRRGNMALSFALHAIMVLAVGAGLVMVKSMAPQIDTHPSVTVRLEPYPFPVGSAASHGGGSGGAAEMIRASKGVAPQSAREQLTPPIVLPNHQPRLTVEASVIAQPDMTMPKTRQVGDPLSVLAVPSNGPGVSGGMGGNYGGGFGTGEGVGRGDGGNRGCCDGVYEVGNGVSMPRAIYYPEPEFSDEARQNKFQGEVTLLATIGVDGIPRNLHVVRSLGMGLDEKALAAVRTWRFDPARLNGHPVTVQMNIIVNFRLY